MQEICQCWKAPQGHGQKLVRVSKSKKEFTASKAKMNTHPGAFGQAICSIVDRMCERGCHCRSLQRGRHGRLTPLKLKAPQSWKAWVRQARASRCMSKDCGFSKAVYAVISLISHLFWCMGMAAPIDCTAAFLTSNALQVSSAGQDVDKGKMR